MREIRATLDYEQEAGEREERGWLATTDESKNNNDM